VPDQEEKITVSDQKGMLPEPPHTTAELRIPLQIYGECQAKERSLSKARIKKELQAMLKRNLLSPPVFVSWVPEDQERLLKQRYPFDFSIPLPMPNMMPRHKMLCEEVSKYVKRLESMELRWLFLARWLRDEFICEPMDILPKKVLDQLTKQFKKKNQISVTKVYYAGLIDNWLPYFELLLEDLSRFPGTKNPGLGQWLINQGHQRSAVECAIGVKRNKRSAISVACEWLVRREDIPDIKKEADAATLRNAYSRVHGSPRQKPPNHS
jgi:hypothetical protein